MKKHPYVCSSGASPSFFKASEQQPRLAPDSAVININLPRTNSAEPVTQLKSTPLKAQMLILTAHEESLISDAIRAQSSSYLPNRSISVRPASDIEKLTAREQEVLELLSKGFLYKEISDQLGIALPTVKSHLRQIYEKLHVQTRTEAAVKFLAAK